MEPSAERVRDALVGVRYPARREDLLASAADDDADTEVVDHLRSLPAGMTFSSETEVTIRIRQRRSGGQ